MFERKLWAFVSGCSKWTSCIWKSETYVSFFLPRACSKRQLGKTQLAWTCLYMIHVALAQRVGTCHVGRITMRCSIKKVLGRVWLSESERKARLNSDCLDLLGQPNCNLGLQSPTENKRNIVRKAEIERGSKYSAPCRARGKDRREDSKCRIIRTLDKERWLLYE
jgi:hypothetical protein